MKIIFLDIDGVLNSNIYINSLHGNFNCVDKVYQIDPKAVELLNKITDATGAFIVVSSTWRIGFIHNRAGLRGLLIKANITGKMLDITPVNNAIRGDQIAEWLRDHKDLNKNRLDKEIKSFIILDDNSDMGKLKKRLVQTDHWYGLQDSHVEKAIRMLNENDSLPEKNND